MVFAALKDDCVDWVEKLCHSTFKVEDLLQTLYSPCTGYKRRILLLI